MTEKEFNKIYEKSILMCKIKCVNSNIREAIKDYKIYKKGKDEVYARQAAERMKKGYYGYECYECRCLPDKEYMLKLINKAFK